MAEVSTERQLNERQKKLVKQLLDLFEAAKKARQDVEPVWEDITSYVLPRITEIKPQALPKAARYGEKMYTSEPVSALRLASDGTSGYMMPRTAHWVRMEPRDRSAYEIPGVRKFFQDSTEVLHAELNRSNFYGEMTPILDNGFSIGTSVAFVEDDEESGSVNIISCDPSEIFISENKYKKVDTFFRYHWMTGEQVLERYPDAVKGKFEEEIKQNPLELHAILHCVYKREDRIHERVDAANKPIASVHILVEKQHLLRESGYDLQRFVAWRHRRIPGTAYGGSPAWDALADILRLNQHSMDLLDASHLAVRPPIAYPSEMYDIDISPNGMNPYRLPGRVPQKLDVLGEFPVGLDREEAIGKAIRDHFQTDFFLLLTHSDRQKTAFEVSEMAGERAAVMSTVIGRIESELIDPVLEIIYNLAYEAGRMPDPPQALLEHGGGEFKWEYVGPLAQLQRRHHGQRTRSQIFMEALPILERFPEAGDILDADALFKEILTEGGMNADLLRDEDEVAAMRRDRAEAEAAQMQAQMMNEAVKAGGGGKKPEPGSPADELMVGGNGARATPSDL